MKDAIGLIGIGLVGTAIAERLIAADYSVVGYDVRLERCTHLRSIGGKAADSGSAVASRARRVIVSVLTSEQGCEVAGGVLEADPLPALVIDTTTGDPRMAETIADMLAGQGVAYVDATISGSSAQVRAGEALFTVGGAAAHVAQVEDLLDILARRWLHVGEVGSGTKIKLVINLILGLNRVALAEGLAFAESMGMELERVVPVLEISMAYSRIMDTKAEKIAEGDYSTQARLDQHRKDVALILELGEQLGQDLPLSQAHLSVLDAAIAAGDAELDNAAVFRELQRRRGPR